MTEENPIPYVDECSMCATSSDCCGEYPYCCNSSGEHKHYIRPHMRRESLGGELAFIDISKCEVGDRVELNGRTGIVATVDTVLPDLSTGLPVMLINWDDQQDPTP